MIRHALILLLSLFAFSPAADARPPMDPEGLEAWADAFFERGLAEHRYSGLGITVVKDGRILLMKGYGYQDVEKGIPVDPRRTQFRIGSISKTFMATALAQLLDRGLIDSLDDPANKYLTRYTVPNAPDGSPITLWHLLTHRAGYEDMSLNIANDVKDVPIPVPAELIEYQRPEIVREPGSMSVYSNWGTGIIGAVVEDVSGQSLRDFLAENVFEPLNMTNSELVYDPEGTPDVGIPRTYYPNGEEEQFHHTGIHPYMAGVGNVYATLEGMGRYMIAHLDKGRSAIPPLMSPQTFEILHGTRVRNHEQGSGFGMIFITHDGWNGEPMFGHGGGWDGYYSNMWMYPESGIGVFTSTFVGRPVPSLWDELANLFFETRLDPAPGVTVERGFATFDQVMFVNREFVGGYQPPNREFAATTDYSVFSGSFLSQRRTFSSAEALATLFSSPVTVEPMDGGLRIDGNGPYREVDKGVFWLETAGADVDPFAQGHQPLYAFTADENGDYTQLTTLVSVSPLMPTTLMNNPATHLKVATIALLVCLSGLLALFWSASPGAERRARWTAVALGVSMIALFATIAAVMGPGANGSSFPEVALGRTGQLVRLLLVTNAIVLVTLYALWTSRAVFASFANGAMGVIKRLHFGLVVLAAVVLVLLFWVYRLIGFQMP